MSLGRLKYFFAPTFFLSTLLVLLNVASAGAAGWWQITASDTVGSGIWNAQPENSGYGSPHGGFATTSNLCRTCHAVHLAGADSWRLIKSGNTTETRSPGEGSVAGMGNRRSTECMYCHDATSGATSMKPYEMSAAGKTVRGEHTLGVSIVPDSDINGGGNLAARDPGGEGAVLQCYQCHSVHGANTIGSTYSASDAMENWNTKILRLDPAGDGTILAKGSGGLTSAEWESELAADVNAVRTGFCADCHNLNPNWSRTADDGDRPNNTSHPQGPGVDSEMEVYGTTKTVAAHPLVQLGCRGCHYASAGGSGQSNFPHQSSGWKLLYDEATATGGTSDLAGDPNRVIPKMDEVCLSCHSVFEDIDDDTTEESDCLVCHDSKYGAPDIGDEIRKASTMGTIAVAGKHKEGVETAADFAAPSNRHAECADCHSAKQIMPAYDGPLDGVSGVQANYGGAGAPVSYTFKTQAANEQELCFKCHSSWTTLPQSSVYFSTLGTTLTQGNKALELNPANSAFHPVQAYGRNKSPNLKQQLLAAFPELNSSSQTVSTININLKCTDCHASDETSGTLGRTANSGFRPQGPHGSAYAPVLRAQYKTTLSPRPAAYSAENFKLCFLCHDPAKLVIGTESNFSDNGLNLHSVHLKRIAEDPYYGPYTWVSICRNCHYNAHGNQAPENTSWWFYEGGAWLTSEDNGGYPPSGLKTHLVSFSPDITPLAPRPKPRWLYNSTDRKRTCQLVCHDGVSMAHFYTPVQATDDTTSY